MTKVTTPEDRRAIKAQDVPQGFELIDMLTMRRRMFFIGKVRHSRTHTTDHGRRYDLRLWQTVAGNYVAEFSDYAVDDPEDGYTKAMEVIIGPDGISDGQVDEIMEFWRWVVPARLIARRMGWSLDKIVP